MRFTPFYITLLSYFMLMLALISPLAVFISPFHLRRLDYDIIADEIDFILSLATLRLRHIIITMLLFQRCLLPLLFTPCSSFRQRGRFQPPLMRQLSSFHIFTLIALLSIACVS